MKNILAGVLGALLLPLSARAENAYTNHAGNAVSGRPVALTPTQVVLAEAATTNACHATTNDVRLSASGSSGPFNLSTFQPFNHERLSALDLPGIRAAAHRGGLRPRQGGAPLARGARVFA